MAPARALTTHRVALLLLLAFFCSGVAVVFAAVQPQTDSEGKKCTYLLEAMLGLTGLFLAGVLGFAIKWRFPFGARRAQDRERLTSTGKLAGLLSVPRPRNAPGLA